MNLVCDLISWCKTHVFSYLLVVLPLCFPKTSSPCYSYCFNAGKRDNEPNNKLLESGLQLISIKIYLGKLIALKYGNRILSHPVNSAMNLMWW